MNIIPSISGSSVPSGRNESVVLPSKAKTPFAAGRMAYRRSFASKSFAKIVLALAASCLILAGESGPLVAQETELPTLIVAPFSGDKVHIQYWQPALGEGLAEMLITEIGKLNKFTVLETTQLGVLKDEIKLGEDGWVDEAEMVEKGGWSAADFMFTAKVTRFGAKESSIGLGGFARRGLGSLGVSQSRSDVRIDWRLVDAASRRVIKTGSATGEEKGLGFDVGVNVTGRGGRISYDNKEFMDSALGKATVKALAEITSELRPLKLPESYRHKQKEAKEEKAEAAASAELEALRSEPGKVLAAPAKNAIIVSLGSNNGFKEGEKLDLYETTDIKDSEGKVVFTDEKLVGELTLESVQEDRSRASYEGDLEIKAGWVVKAKQ